MEVHYTGGSGGITLDRMEDEGVSVSQAGAVASGVNSNMAIAVFNVAPAACPLFMPETFTEVGCE